MNDDPKPTNPRTSEPSLRRASTAKPRSTDSDLRSASSERPSASSEPQELSKEEALALFDRARPDPATASAQEETPAAPSPSAPSLPSSSTPPSPSATTQPRLPLPRTPAARATAGKDDAAAPTAGKDDVSPRGQDPFSSAFQATAPTDKPAAKPTPTRPTAPSSKRHKVAAEAVPPTGTKPATPTPSRRSFLGLVLGLGGLAAGVTPLVYAAAKRPPRSMVSNPTEWHMLLPIADWKELLREVNVPRRMEVTSSIVEGWRVHQQIHVVYALRRSDMLNDVQVFSAVCPHAGCLVEWAGKEGHFACPCHHASFGVDGSRKDEKSPAPRDLDPLEVRVTLAGLEVRPRRFRLNVPTRIAL